MVPATQLRKGSALRFRDELCVVLDQTHVTPGKGHAFMQVVMRNLRTGRTLTHRFGSSEQVETVPKVKRVLEYSYRDTSGFVFMDPETFESITLTENLIEDAAQYLVENTPLEVSFVDDGPIAVELPPVVTLEVATSPDGARGNTATSATKVAELETGLKVTVPLFVKTGDKVRVDTRTGEYQGRA